MKRNLGVIVTLERQHNRKIYKPDILEIIITSFYPGEA